MFRVSIFFNFFSILLFGHFKNGVISPIYYQKASFSRYFKTFLKKYYVFKMIYSNTKVNISQNGDVELQKANNTIK